MKKYSKISDYTLHVDDKWEVTEDQRTILYLL